MESNATAEGRPPHFSIAIPCFNEEGAIAETIADLYKKLADAGPYEIIVIDDGSSDQTPELLQRAQEEFPSLVVETHPQNRGYGAAVKSGIRRAKSDIIVITDADGTYPNEQIPKLVELLDNCEMAIGARTSKEAQYSSLRSIPKAFLRTYASWIAGQHIPDMNSGLRAFRKTIAEQFLTILPNTFSLTTTLTLAFLTNHYRVLYHPIAYFPRIGKSHIKPIRDTLRFIQLIVRTGMYFAPLRILMPVVALLSLAFFISLIYDTFWEQNLTDKTVLLLVFAMNTGMVALLADMIDKRTGR